MNSAANVGQRSEELSAPGTPLIDVRGLSITFDLDYGPLNVVRNVDFTIPRGKTVALVGESGAGKSLISRALIGLLPKTARISDGLIWHHDKGVDMATLDRDGDTMREIRGGGISMIFQEPMTSLSPFHTIGNQIGEAYELHAGDGRGDTREAVVAVLKQCRFPQPDAAFDRYPFELSGGLRQRAMIAMALITSPDLLIADEPTTALDVSVQAEILALIRDLQAELGMSVLVITHDLGVVANVADEVVVLYNGEVMERGPLEDIYRRPEHTYLKALMSAVPHFDMKPGERLKPLREIDVALDGLAPVKASTDKTKPILTVTDLHKQFVAKKGGGLFGSGDQEIVRAVDGVSLRVGEGETVGLVGESGCGKTTLSKLIMGALLPDAGSIDLQTKEAVASSFESDLGETVKLNRPEGLALPRAIQMVFQDPFSSLNPRMTLFDIIREPLVIQGEGDRDFHIDKVQAMLKLVGLDPRMLNRYPHSLSGGQRQRIAMARALLLEPEIVLLDEPTSALDVSVQAQVLNLLKDLQSELGLSYLLISHNLAVVDYMAERIYVMCRGRIVEEAPRETLFSNPVHPYTQQLMKAVPFADLDHPLDFDAARGGQHSAPDEWPDPFRLPPGATGRLVPLTDGIDHRVLLQEEASLGDIAA